MSFKNYLREDMRLVTLRLLDEMPSFTSNSSLISTGLHGMGHAVSRDVVKTELRWLEEQGLIEITEAESVFVVKLTERGQDVAEGRARVDGVKVPRA